MSEDKVSEVFGALEKHNGTYPREHIDAALALRVEMTPYLLKVLEEVLADPSAYMHRPDYFGHIYALILLGHFREARAHKLVIDLFSQKEEIVNELFGDMITEDLPIILYRTCDGCVDSIKSLALNMDAYDFCRGSALRALVFAVADGVLPRTDAVNFFGSLFTGTEAYPNSEFWTLAIDASYDLCPKEIIETITQAFERKMISTIMTDYSDFRRAIKQGPEQCLRKIREQMQSKSLDNIHDYMSWWACFKPEKERRPVSLPRNVPLFSPPIVPRKKFKGSKKTRGKERRARKVPRKKIDR